MTYSQQSRVDIIKTDPISQFLSINGHGRAQWTNRNTSILPIKKALTVECRANFFCDNSKFDVKNVR